MPDTPAFDINSLAGLMPPAMSSRDAQILSLVQALHDEDRHQRPSASPLGAIANALIPVLTAPVRARQLEAQSQAQQLPIMLQLLSLAQQSAKAPLENRKLVADTTKAEAEAKGMEAGAKTREQMMQSPIFKQLFGGAAGPTSGAAPVAGTGPTGELPASGTTGMKPRITMNAKGEPSITFTSDVMSDQAMAQHEALARINAAGAASARMPYEMQLADAASKRQENTRRSKPLPTSMVAFDPNGNRVSGATAGDVEDGLVKSIPKSDADAVAQAQEAMRQLSELKELSTKLLPKYSAGLATRAVTLGQNLKERTKGNPDQARFDMLSNFANLPAISALNRMRRLPLAEVNKLATPSRLMDTQESAAAKIDELQNMLSGLVNSFGLDPAILDKAPAGKPVKTLPGGIQVFKNE